MRTLLGLRPRERRPGEVLRGVRRPRSRPPRRRASSVRRSPSSSATSPARPRSASRPIRRRFGSARPLLRADERRSSSRTAGRWRSSSAMRSWPSSAFPQVHEDDALRAVRAAVEMRDALPELGLQARIGVNTGEVVTGTEERLATGDAVNVAARLEQAAQPGEILIGEATLALVRDAVEAEAVEPLELKGRRSRCRLPAGRGPRGARAPHETPFVGRRARARNAADGLATRSATSNAVSSSPSSASRRRQVATDGRVPRLGRGAESSAAAACPTARGSPTGRSSRC